MTFYQKEYSSNFLYPSIYYLFGKYASKSASKTLKTVAISALQEVFRLLNEDLQYSTLYWLGNIFYNIGQYESCHKIWRYYLDNSEKAFDFSIKKHDKIKCFNSKYELLCNSLYQLRHNINYYKKSTLELKKSEIENFFADIEQIKNLQPNLKENYDLMYDYFKSLVYLDVSSKFN